MEYRITPGRLEIGKFSLYYERVGAGAPIVFLHGLGGNHLSWWQQVPYFMRSFECVTVDQRGFGLSPDPEGLFNREHASDLAALLDHLKIDQASASARPFFQFPISAALRSMDRSSIARRFQ